MKLNVTLYFKSRSDNAKSLESSALSSIFFKDSVASNSIFLSALVWAKLQEGINSEFERQIDETKKNLQLTDSENVERAICSMFGCHAIYRQHKKEKRDER